MTLPEAARPFNANAKEYDSWYDTSPLFAIELAAIRATTIRFVRPGLEVGVGTGRFARALGVKFGLDPALSPLQLAHHRSIIPINGIGEQLPVRTQSIGTVYLFFTLCFLADPAAVFTECFRVLKPEGLMVIGFIPRLSPWGKHLSSKGRENHPYYRFARFQTVAETGALLAGSGFTILEAWSTLFQPPAPHLAFEHPKPGASENAGCCVLLAGKKGGFLESCQPDHPDN